MKKTGLGRGLGSLIPKKENILTNKNNLLEEGKIFNIAIENIKANPYQPRELFDEENLSDLSLSIKEHGILQPLVVSNLGDNNYELIAGERRLRASKIAGLKNVPVIVKSVDNFSKLHLAIIENLQRSNLNSIEEARAFEKLVKEFNMTHESVAKTVGKSRSFVSNTLRLLTLPKDIQEAIEKKKLNAGQARSLVVLPEKEQRELFSRIIGNSLSSRQVEQEAKKVGVKKHIRTIHKDPNLVAKEDDLAGFLGTKISIKKKNNGGQIIIDFYSEEELNSIMEKIKE